MSSATAQTIKTRIATGDPARWLIVSTCGMDGEAGGPRRTPRAPRNLRTRPRDDLGRAVGGALVLDEGFAEHPHRHFRLAHIGEGGHRAQLVGTLADDAFIRLENSNVLFASAGSGKTAKRRVGL